MALQQATSRFSSVAESSLERRALAHWPRLDKDALRRCGHDPARIIALISRRTALPPESVRQVLVMPDVTEDEAETWFG